jgi:hypothetical protein
MQYFTSFFNQFCRNLINTWKFILYLFIFSISLPTVCGADTEKASLSKLRGKRKIVALASKGLSPGNSCVIYCTFKTYYETVFPFITPFILHSQIRFIHKHMHNELLTSSSSFCVFFIHLRFKSFTIFHPELVYFSKCPKWALNKRNE